MADHRDFEASREHGRCSSSYRGLRCDRSAGHYGRHEAANCDNHSWAVWDDVAADAKVRP